MVHHVNEHQLSSGGRGLFIDVPGSDVFDVLVRFNSGFQFTDPLTYELPHVMEHLMATRSQKYPGPNEFTIEAQKNGASVNAYTSSEINGFTYECADFEFDRILDLIEEQLVRPRFTQADLDIERRNVREELTKYTTDHQRVCSAALSSLAYPGQVLGYDERIRQLPDIDLEAIKIYYNHAFGAANARFYIAGPIGNRSEELVKRLERLFDGLPGGKSLTVDTSPGRNVAQPIETRRDIAQVYYRLSAYSGELDLRERRALTLLRLTLVGGFGSRIMGEARTRGLAYGLGMFAGAGPGNTEVGFSGYVTAVNARDLCEVITRHCQAVKDGELTKLELDQARTLGIGSTKRSYQTVSDIMGWYVGGYDEECRINDFDTYLSELETVTPDDVTQVARKVFATEAHGMSLLGDITPELTRNLVAITSPIFQ